MYDNCGSERERESTEKNCWSLALPHLLYKIFMYEMDNAVELPCLSLVVV